MAVVEAEVRLATFNLGLLQIKAPFGYIVKESPPHVEERFPYICEALANCTAQIVALQEIYEQSHVDALLAAVKDKYPHHARGNTHYWGQFHNGLLFLSQFPIDYWDIKKHAQSSALEQIFGSKACLTVHIETPVGKLCLANLHTTAGGGTNTESEDCDTVRESELQEAIDVCEQWAQLGCKSLVVGDLNCGPEASAPNYDFMEQQGYVDMVKPFAEEVGPTWDATSKLNNMEVFAESPSQRIDHFFAHKDAGLVAIAAKKLFTDSVVPLDEGGELVPLSDHYGVEVLLRAV